MSKTDYMENVVLNWIKGTPTTPPANVYIALFSAAPSDAGGGTELTNGTAPAYARQLIQFGAISSGQIQNSNLVSFPTATGNWPTVTHWAIFDAASGGNMLRWGALTTSKTIATGEQLSFPIGTVLLSED